MRIAAGRATNDFTPTRLEARDWFWKKVRNSRVLHRVRNGVHGIAISFFHLYTYIIFSVQIIINKDKDDDDDEKRGVDGSSCWTGVESVGTRLI